MSAGPKRGARPLSRDRAGGRLGGDEFERDAVDAVAQAGGLGAVVEHVAEMAAAAAAMDLVPEHAEGPVLALLDRALDRRVEARPARAGFELRLGFEEWQVAAGAGELAHALLFVERAGPGALGILFAQNRVLLWRKSFTPLRWRLGDLEMPSVAAVAS